MNKCVVCNNELSGQRKKYCSTKCKTRIYNLTKRKTKCAKCNKEIWKRRSGNIYCNNCTIRRGYSYEDAVLAVETSTSIAQVLGKLGIIAAGGNYATIKKYLKNNNIDTSHFKGMAWNKDRKLGPKRPIEDYLSNEYPIGSNALKKRLILQGIFKKECSNCNLTRWMDNDIPLELDHINGNHSDNSLSNLRLLCPNCHAMTDTYRGKNMNK